MTEVQQCGERRPQLYERQDFASAKDKYDALTRQERGTDLLQTRLSNYTETDTLSETEAEIFDIDPGLTADLFWAYERYLNLIGTCDAYFGEHQAQERLDHPKYFKGEGVHEIDLAVDFMARVCGLSVTQSLGWVLKITAAELRGGIIYDTRYESGACASDSPDEHGTGTF